MVQANRQSNDPCSQDFGAFALALASPDSQPNSSTPLDGILPLAACEPGERDVEISVFSRMPFATETYNNFPQDLEALALVF